MTKIDSVMKIDSVLQFDGEDIVDLIKQLDLFEEYAKNKNGGQKNNDN